LKYFFLGFFLLIGSIVYFFSKETIEPIAFVESPDKTLNLNIYNVTWGGAIGGISHRAELLLKGKSKGVLINSFNKRPLTKFCIKWTGNNITIFQPLKGWPGLRQKRENIFLNKKLYHVEYIELNSILEVAESWSAHCISQSITHGYELWAPTESKDPIP